MKIIFFGYSEGWGLTFHLTYLMIALKKAGVDIIAVSNGKEQSSGLHKLLNANSIPSININEINFSEWVNKILDYKNDLIFHCQGFRQVNIVRKSFWNKKYAIILTMNAYRGGKWYKRFYCIVSKLLFSKLISTWIFPSYFARRDYTFMNSISNAYVIPLGLEEYKGQDLNNNIIINKYSLIKDKKYLIYLAQFSKNKRHHFLISSLFPFLKRRDDIELLLFGSGNYLNKCKKYVKILGIEKNVRFYGRVDRNEILIILNFLKGKAINVVSTKIETFGHNIIEPLYMGIPTVSIGTGIAEKVIEDFYNGFVLPEKADKKEFRQAIEYSVNNLANLSKYSIKLNSWDDIASRYKSLYYMVNKKEKV